MSNAFYSDNEHRDYPFTDGADVGNLPEDAVVDFLCVIGQGVTPAAVYLNSVSKASGVLTFEFAGPAVVLTTNPLLRFAVAVTADEFTTLSASAVDHGGAPFGGPCDDGLVWDGTLTVGKLGALAALIPEGTTASFGAGAVINPARVQDLNRTYLRSLSIANQSRTHATAPAGCTAYPTDGFDDAHFFVWSRCVPSRPSPVNLVIKEGYNCQVRLDPADNSMTVSAGVGAGLGVPCGEVPVVVGELPVTGSLFLSGGPACSQVVTSFNGLSASEIRLTAGTGFTIMPDPGDANGVLVDADLHDLAIPPAG